jgi:hypothetical protein
MIAANITETERRSHGDASPKAFHRITADGRDSRIKISL